MMTQLPQHLDLDAGHTSLGQRATDAWHTLSSRAQEHPYAAAAIIGGAAMTAAAAAYGANYMLKHRSENGAQPMPVRQPSDANRTSGASSAHDYELRAAIPS